MPFFLPGRIRSHIQAELLVIVLISILVPLIFILLCVFLCLCIKVSNKVAPRQPASTKDGVKRITVVKRPSTESIKAIESDTAEGVEYKTIGSVKAIKSEAVGNEAMTTTDWAEFEANSTVRDEEIEPEPIKTEWSLVKSGANSTTEWPKVESEDIKGEQLTIEAEAIREETIAIREEAIEFEVVKDKAIESEATESKMISTAWDDAFESETTSTRRDETNAIFKGRDGAEWVEPMTIEAQSIEVTECVSTEIVEAIESDANWMKPLTLL